MKITAITTQKKRSDRYSVYIDGNFAFGLGEGDLLRLGLVKNQEITQQELDELQSKVELAKAYDKALNYLDYRPRSVKEIRDYLSRKDYSNDVITSVIDKLHSAGLVDDRRFARQWIEWRANTRPRSRMQLIKELRQKGIDNEIIDQSVAEIDDQVEIQQIKQLIAKYENRYSSREKLLAYLSRQGYSYDVIRQAFSELESSQA